ncbi:MAG: MerR family transcriptional regulator [Betaproteobacteria bacterium]|nr:MAG: MerR family transcriptional regulator [Betaproteobacteria bacterium]
MSQLDYRLAQIDMTTTRTNSATAGYPIGVVARLTGIRPTTLRIWERRYGLVRPSRTEGKNRLYSEDDLRRLTLVKTLVDAGHQISLLAPLSAEQLRHRLESTTARLVEPGKGDTPPVRVTAVGGSMPERLKATSQIASAQGVEFTASFSSEQALLDDAATSESDVLLLEYATVHHDTLAKVQSLLTATGASRAVVVYGIAASQALQDLGSAGVICLRAPVPIADLVSTCRNVSRPGPPALATIETYPSEQVPPRRFSPEQLVRISTRAPAIACECPHHLVDLINSMAAFETYSRECENKNPQDAQIHAFLSVTAGRSRAMLEAALQRVAEFEGIDIS